MGKIRVLVADDHAVVRAGLRLLINSQPDMEAVGEAGDGGEAVRKARELTPDVVTLDLTMPGGGGVRAIERLRQECPHARVVALTMHDDPAYLRAALAAGGFGYVAKTAADTELLTAIRAVFRGRIFVNVRTEESHALAGATGGVQGGRPGKAGCVASLSGREREVFALLAQAHTNQEVADRLFLSVKTVETYRARIADKFGLRTRADFVRYALEIGLLNAETTGLPET